MAVRTCSQAKLGRVSPELERFFGGPFLVPTRISCGEPAAVLVRLDTQDQLIFMCLEHAARLHHGLVAETVSVDLGGLE